MNKELLAFLTGLLSTAYKLDEIGVAALFNADGTPTAEALQKVLDLDKSRVSELTKGKFDEGFKAAEKKVKTDFEKDLKKKFGVDVDKQGVELVEAILEAKTPQGAELTEDQVKKSKWYLDLSESVKAQVDTAIKATKDEFEQFKQTVERGKTFEVVKGKALPLFKGWKPILSSDPIKAANQEALLVRELNQLPYRLDGDKVILLNADGSDMVDGHNNRVDFEKHVRSIADKYFDFETAAPRDGAGGKGPNDGGGGGGGKKYIVKDEADFMKQMAVAKGPEEKAGITTAWQEAQNAQK